MFYSFTTDEKGHKIGYLKLGDKSVKFIVTECAQGNIVASTYLLDLLVIFSRNYSGEVTPCNYYSLMVSLHYNYDQNYNIIEVKAV